MILQNNEEVVRTTKLNKTAGCRSNQNNKLNKLPDAPHTDARYPSVSSPGEEVVNKDLPTLSVQIHHVGVRVCGV